jgi:nicotinate phosphoribosyltransferase
MIDISKPIITSLADDDLYKFTMGAVVFHNFPNAVVTYGFKNRGKTTFPPMFKEHLEHQIGLVGELRFRDWELKHFQQRTPYLRDSYIDFLAGFQMNPNSVVVTLSDDGELTIAIKGKWYREIFWEVKLMAIISELFFRMTGVVPSFDSERRIEDKAAALSDAGCKWCEFGTRRRFSKEVQSAVVSKMRFFKGFLGTSNVDLSRQFDCPVVGTSAHEAVMAMSALVGYRNANITWMNYWQDYYKGELGIALPDTFTTKVFLRTFDAQQTRLWDGLRQDSGKPERWMDEDIIPHYAKYKIPTRDKKILFSDNLNVTKAISLNNQYGDDFNVISCIGTNFTNDVLTDEQKTQGIKPLNMVIKMTSADFGDGVEPTIKLSDDEGKYTGEYPEIEFAKTELGIW